MSKARNLANFIGIPAINSSANATAITISSSEDISVGSAANHAGARIVINDTPPTAFGSPMFQIGQETFTASGYYSIGLGYTAGSYTEPPAEIAAVATSSSGGTTADIVFGTRSVTTNTAVTERMRIDSSGKVGIGTTGPNQLLTLGSNTGSATIGLDFETTTVSRGSILYNAGAGEMAFTSGYSGYGGYMTFDCNGSERMRIDTAGRVGIGVTSMVNPLQIAVTPNDASKTSGSAFDGAALRLDGNLNGANKEVAILGGANDNLSAGIGFARQNSTDWGTQLRFYTHGAATTTTDELTERMRIDSGGNVLVGKTTLDNSNIGCRFNATGDGSFVASGNRALVVVRKSSDGEMALFLKDSTTVGKLTTRSGQFAIGCTGTGLEFNDSNDAIIPFSPNANNTRDNALDLGMSSVRFNQAYIYNGVTQGSDEREKQEIAQLDEAETRVAVACKGLLRKWRWKDAVEAKDNNPSSDKIARIHFGIIAQNLKAAFEAEGLDAGRYGMFMHDTWTDEETGEERDRMGIRYSELLAFIIAAI